MRYYAKVGVRDLDGRGAQALVEASVEAPDEAAARDAAAELATRAITARHGAADRKIEVVLCREDAAADVAGIVWTDMRERRRM